MIASQVNIEKALSINGWMSIQELTWLATQASRVKKIVEFGSFQGRSTRALADNILPNGTIWAVDPWNGDYFTEEGDSLRAVNTYVMPQFCENLREHIKVGTVIPVRGYSFGFTLPIKVDMVFIDGDHRYESVKRDIKKALELLKPDGLICGHDYGHPLWTGVTKAVDELIIIDGLEDTIWFKAL